MFCEALGPRARRKSACEDLEFAARAQSEGLAVAPLDSGSGMKIKTLDYLGAGLATVGTEEAFVGLDRAEEIALLGVSVRNVSWAATRDGVEMLYCGYVRGMGLMQAAGWGLAGGLAAGVVAMMAAVNAAGYRWPWQERSELWPRLFVFVGGCLLGGLVAAAAHGQISGPWPAFIMGAGAPATVRGVLGGIEVSERGALPKESVVGGGPGGQGAG